MPLSEYRHPMRSLDIHVFKNLDQPDSYIARFYPYDACPIFFRGSTEEEAREKAEADRQEAIEKHEANVISAKKRIAKAKATKEKRKLEKGNK